MRIWAFSAALVLGLSQAGNGRAEAPSSGPASDAVLVPRDASSEAAARDHFDRALAEYRAGKYRNAVRELDQALAEDPGGKDLVFNLALVHEKLGELELAISYLERFLQMETDPTERSRAEQAILRMRGAREEALRAQPPAPNPKRVPDAPPQAPQEEPRYGRFDGWVATSAGLSAVAIVVVVVFGVRAIEQQRSWKDEASKPGASLDEISQRADEAQTSAFVANVAFSLGVVSAGGAAILYFARPAVPSSGHPNGLKQASLPADLGLRFSAEF